MRFVVGSCPGKRLFEEIVLSRLLTIGLRLYWSLFTSSKSSAAYMLAKISVILNVLHAWCLQRHLELGLHLAQLLKPCGYLMWTRCSWGCLLDILDLVSILARYSSRVAMLSALSDSILSLILFMLLFTLFMLMFIWVRKGCDELPVTPCVHRVLAYLF